jgi:hypothetical protein
LLQVRSPSSALAEVSPMSEPSRRSSCEVILPSVVSTPPDAPATNVRHGELWLHNVLNSIRPAWPHTPSARQLRATEPPESSTAHPEKPEAHPTLPKCL